MNKEEGICIALLSAILAICFFSPNYSECFKNFEFFNSDSWALDRQHFGWVGESDPDKNYKGPQRQLNEKNLQAGFPYYNTKKLKQSMENGTRDAGINDYTGPIVNGYQPSIIRPPDFTGHRKSTADGTACSWPCYSGSKNQEWCNEDDAINYYAMRPLVTPKNYNGWLTNLFNVIVTPGNSVVKLLDSKLVPKIFCSDTTTGERGPFSIEDEQQKLMKWLMERIAGGVNKIPQMKKNASWVNEEFHHTDVNMYAFEADDGKGSVYKVIFNLYNPLRSTSTLVEAVVISPNNRGYVLAKMDFVNKGEWDSTNMNLPEGMRGYNLPKANGDLVIDTNSPGLPNSTLLHWNYANTLNIQEFNEFGYYEHGKNLEIKGGVPDSLKSAISKYEGKMLLECGVPRFTGINSETDKVVRNNGIAQVVKNNPMLIYKKAEWGGPSPVYV